MLTFTLGTFAIALNHLLLISALALATFVGWRVAKRGGENPESVLFSLFLIGMLAARVGFVAVYWTHYRNDPWQIIDLRDGGFLAWPGVIALVLAALYRGWRRPGLRRPLGFGVASGLAFWLLATFSLTIYEQGTRLPDITLRNAAGETVQLADYKGGPLVINLWATWCPPCRREMPVLEDAQQQRPDLTFLFVNQAESMQSVSTFLETQGLSLSNVLFDGSGRLGQAVGSMALPTTLFYSPDGRLLGSHLGELSQASLARALENFDTLICRTGHFFKETAMPRLRHLLTLTLGAALLHLPSVQAAEELPEAIKKIEAKGAKIVGQFDAPDGLRGYAAQYQNRGMALYLTPDGKHVLLGNLYDAEGNDLSSAPLQKLVYAPMAKEVWAKMETSNWIADGNKDAPRVVYMFSDPNCPYCNMFWEQARPWVKAGKVQLRHIMVGIIREDSPGKSAALLAAKDPQKALEDHEACRQGQLAQGLERSAAGDPGETRGEHAVDGRAGVAGDAGDFLYG